MQSRHEETDTLGPPAYNCEWVGKRFARTHLVVEEHAALPLLAELARVAVAHAGVAEAVVLVLVILRLVVVVPAAVRPRRGAAAAAAGRVGRRPRRRRPPGVRGARQQRGEVVARTVHGRPADVGVLGALDDLRERERREGGERERGERGADVGVLMTCCSTRTDRSFNASFSSVWPRDRGARWGQGGDVRQEEACLQGANKVRGRGGQWRDWDSQYWMQVPAVDR